MTLSIALSCTAILLAVAVLAVVIGREAMATSAVYGLCAVAALISLLVVMKHLLGAAAPESMALPLGIPWLGAHFRVDALSAFFLAIVDLGALTTSVFALGYGSHEEAPLRVLPFYPAFLAGMSLVVLADDAFTFLVSWEFMSLTSWALVMSHHRVPENVRAGYIYLVMASFGTLALLLAFGLLAGPDGHYSFAQIRAAHPTAGLAALVLILALVGAGSKAGLVPLHVWLPLAHPAAPSHVSALMSGVMTKVAVYGFVRIVFDLAGEPAWWWSMVVLALGGVTSWLRGEERIEDFFLHLQWNADTIVAYPDFHPVSEVLGRSSKSGLVVAPSALGVALGIRTISAHCSPLWTIMLHLELLTASHALRAVDSVLDGTGLPRRSHPRCALRGRGYGPRMPVATHYRLLRPAVR